MTPGWRAINRRVERGQTADDAKYGKSGHGSVHHSLDSSEVASEFLSLSAVPDQSYAHVAKQHKEKQHHGHSSSSSSSDSQLPRTHGQSNSPRSGKQQSQSQSQSQSQQPPPQRKRKGVSFAGVTSDLEHAEGMMLLQQRKGVDGGAGANTAGLEYAEDATLVRDTILAAQEEYKSRFGRPSGPDGDDAAQARAMEDFFARQVLREKSARRRRQAERIERAAVAS